MRSLGDNVNISSAAMRAWLFFARQDVKYLHLQPARLQRRNQSSRASVVAPGGPVVSMTTFGRRLPTVHLTLESIAAGSMLPSRLLLWLQDEETYASRPDSVRRLEQRGLEVLLTDTYGSHSKYYPYLLSADHFSAPLVTADDDVFYSRWWLSGLTRSHEHFPDVVNCYRAHSIPKPREGALAPYSEWRPCTSTRPSYLHFATGGGGCIYPATFLSRLKSAGTDFLTLCPKADDVWLHANELRAGVMVRQIGTRPFNFANIPGTQENALYRTNVHSGENDQQIRKTYSQDDIRLLAES